METTLSAITMCQSAFHLCLNKIFTVDSTLHRSICQAQYVVAALSTRMCSYSVCIGHSRR